MQFFLFLEQKLQHFYDVLSEIQAVFATLFLVVFGVAIAVMADRIQLALQLFM